MTKTPPREDISLDELAAMLKVHPRTVIRKVPGNDVNAYWAKGFNPVVNISDIGQGLEADDTQFRKVVDACRRKKDEIMTPTEMSAFLQIPLRTFRHRKYPAVVRQGNIVRFSRFETANYNLEKYLLK